MQNVQQTLCVTESLREHLRSRWRIHDKFFNFSDARLRECVPLLSILGLAGGGAAGGSLESGLGQGRGVGTATGGEGA
jgi:hypothetical protein